ncbi:MAG: 50S ribosomal protein L33 [Candidatus Bipolaricaulota bacterium]
MREQVILTCSECGRRNYHTEKNPRNDKDKLELRKYCKWCKDHTLHVEK